MFQEKGIACAKDQKMEKNLVLKENLDRGMTQYRVSQDTSFHPPKGFFLP